jgi:hypothetical protein
MVDAHEHCPRAECAPQVDAQLKGARLEPVRQVRVGAVDVERARVEGGGEHQREEHQGGNDEDDGWQCKQCSTPLRRHVHADGESSQVKSSSPEPCITP